MTLQVLSILPQQGDNDVTIDTNIVINFNQAIDPFTVENGVSIYFIDQTGDYNFVEYEYTILGNRLTLVPKHSLKADTKHYVSVLPGNDPSRFISSQTVSDVTYSRIYSSTGTANTLSYFGGDTNVSYNIFIGPNKIANITKGDTSIGSFDYSNGAIIGDKDLPIKLDGTFDIGDEINISCFKASGVDSIYKVDFTTSKYNVITPGSTLITTEDLDAYEDNKLYIVDSIPEDLSVDNIKCNPIVIKFNKPLSDDQDIKSKLTIRKSDILGSKKKYVDYDYVISDNILKIYMKSVGNPEF